MNGNSLIPSMLKWRKPSLLLGVVLALHGVALQHLHISRSAERAPVSELEALFVQLPSIALPPKPVVAQSQKNSISIEKTAPRQTVTAAPATHSVQTETLADAQAVQTTAPLPATTSGSAEPSQAAANTESRLEQTAPALAPPPPISPSPATPQFSVLLPPAAKIQYAVTAEDKGQFYRANGEYDWRLENARYLLKTEVSLLFLSASYNSVGAVDAHGIAPVRYEEKMPRRSLVATNFNREIDKPSITFSASTTRFDLQAGSQDRATAAFQLAGILRGAANAQPRKIFNTGEGIEIFVAGTKDAEPWVFVYQGSEKISSSLAPLPGGFEAQHWSRTPRAGSYQQTLDVWFVPEQNYLPLRLRFEQNPQNWYELNAQSVEMK